MLVENGGCSGESRMADVQAHISSLSVDAIDGATKWSIYDSQGQILALAARFWSWLSVERPQNLSRFSLFARKLMGVG